MSSKQADCGWELAANIPTKGTGVVGTVPRKLPGHEVANVDLGEFVNLIDRYRSLTKADVLAWSKWVHGDSDTRRVAPLPGEELTMKAVDVNAPGNDGLVARLRVQQRTVSHMMHQCLKAMMPMVAYKAFLLQKQLFVYRDEISGRNAYCGIVLAWLVITKCKPQLYVNVMDLENKLENLTLAQCGHDVVSLTTKMIALREEIIVQKGNAHALDDPRMLTLLFKALETSNNPDFSLLVRIKKAKFIEGDVAASDFEEVVRSLSNVYNNMVHDKTWGKQDPRDAQLLALTTKIKSLEAARKSSKSGGGGRGGAPRGNGGGRGNGGKTESKSRAPEWQVTKVGKDRKHPETGETMTWCPHHVSRDGSINGMYMPHDHDHDAWVVAKKAKFADYKAKKEQLGAAKRKPADATGSTPVAKKGAGPSKLALNKGLVKSLTSRFNRSSTRASLTLRRTRKTEWSGAPG